MSEFVQPPDDPTIVDRLRVYFINVVLGDSVEGYAGVVYRPAYSPFVISTDFCLPGQRAAKWELKRNLLWDGLEAPASSDDVQVFPPEPRGWLVRLHLSSGRQNAVVGVGREALRPFLQRTYTLVPRGSEEAWLRPPSV